MHKTGSVTHNLLVFNEKGKPYGIPLCDPVGIRCFLVNYLIYLCLRCLYFCKVEQG